LLSDNPTRATAATIDAVPPGETRCTPGCIEGGCSWFFHASLKARRLDGHAGYYAHRCAAACRPAAPKLFRDVGNAMQHPPRQEIRHKVRNTSAAINGGGGDSRSRQRPKLEYIASAMVRSYGIRLGQNSPG